MTILRALATATLGLALAAAPALADTARFGSGQQGSQNYGVNAALGQAIDDGTDLEVSVQAFGGPTAFLPLVDTGELEFAAVVTPDVGDAVRGTGPFEGLKLENVRLVAALFPSPVGLMVRKDSGIETIADLKGKRVAGGLTAQASLVPYVEGALANGGLSMDDVTVVPVASVANGVDELVAGRVDATLFALRGGKVVEADSSVGVKWLPFDASTEAVARMQAVAPEAYLVPVTPEDKVVGAPTAIETMAYDYVLVAGAGVPDASVAAVATLLKEKGAEIAAGSKVLGAIKPDGLGRVYPQIPHHPAAAAVLGVTAN